MGIRLVSRFRFSRSQIDEAVDVGEHEVQEDQLGLAFRDRRLDLRTREELDRLESASPDEAGQDIVGVALIVDDQNGARHGQNSKGLREIDRFFRSPRLGTWSQAFSRARTRVARVWSR